MILNVEIKNRVAVYKPSGEKPVCGNSGDTVIFTFDAEWEAHDQKTARFIWNKRYFDVEFTGETCEIPVITGASAFMVGVYVGEHPESETLLSSTYATIPIELSVRCATNAPNAGTGVNYTNEAKGHAAAAAASATNAKASENAAAASATNAKASENAAAASAASAKASEEKTNSNMNKVEEYIEQIMSFDPFITDATNKSIKDVPEKALFFAEVTKIGGMTYKDGDTLKHAKVTEVESVGVNLFDKSNLVNTAGLKVFEDKIVVTASAVDASVNSTILLKDFAPFLRVGDIVTLNASTTGTTKYVWIDSIWNFGEAKTITETLLNSFVYFYASGTGTSATISEIMLNKGSTAQPYTPYVKHIFPIPEAVQALDGYGLGVNDTVYNYIDWEKQRFVKRVGVVDLGIIEWTYQPNAEDLRWQSSEFSSVMELPTEVTPNAIFENYATVSIIAQNADTALQCATVYAGKVLVRNGSSTTPPSGILVYELAKPIVTDISDLITDENLVRVKAGGTVTFVNEHAKDVPNTIIYQVVR